MSGFICVPRYVDIISGTSVKTITRKTPRTEFVTLSSKPVSGQAGEDHSIRCSPLSAFSKYISFFMSWCEGHQVISRLIRAFYHFNNVRVLANKHEKMCAAIILDKGQDPGTQSLFFFYQLGQNEGWKVSAYRPKFLAWEPQASPWPLSPQVKVPLWGAVKT